MADGLSSPSWRQSNSFSGKGTQYEYMNNEFGRIFTEGSPNVSGLTFNDVAVTSTDKEGFPASVPASVEAGREYEFSYTFDLSDVDNADCLMAPDRLRVIAVLLDAGAGQVVNSNSSAYPDASPFVGRRSRDGPLRHRRHTPERSRPRHQHHTLFRRQRPQSAGTLTDRMGKFFFGII